MGSFTNGRKCGRGGRQHAVAAAPGNRTLSKPALLIWRPNRDATDMSNLVDYPDRQLDLRRATAVPGANHYREVAGMLREAARSCQFTGARKEILHLAERFESRADHLDRRAGSTTTPHLA